MAERRCFLDVGHGETRGVVTLDGRPERLLIARDDDWSCQALGARGVGRVTSIDRTAGLAFIELPEGPDAALNLKPGLPAITQGMAVEIEVKTEARGGKGPTVSLVRAAEGRPRLLAPAPSIEQRLQSLARGGDIETGLWAREVADRAQDEVLDTLFPLPSGGRIAVETTRALTAVDIDLGAGPRAEAKSAARSANLAGIREAARILRLKGLGGLVVIDLIGRGHDGPALLTMARAAFAADNPGVAIGPVSRFGLMEIAIPRRTRPVFEILCDSESEPNAVTQAMTLLRALEREALADPGARFEAIAPPPVAAAAAGGLKGLVANLGARLAVRGEAGRSGCELVRQ